jgi:hypothetical protein
MNEHGNVDGLHSPHDVINTYYVKWTDLPFFRSK